MMKKFFAMAAVVLALCACGGKDNPDTPGGGGGTTKLDVTGIWELNSVAAKASVGGLQVSVYIDFASGGSFTLYQKIGEGRYTKFSGSYTLSSDGKLSGSYSGGESWGPYAVSLSGDTLTLTSASGKEVDTYKKVSSIPASVTGNLY